jgi:hypothetical protein
MNNKNKDGNLTNVS